MYLDTTRLIAKHTDNIVDEVWNYINGRKFVELAILLLAAQKQLRGPVNGGRSKASRDGFDVVRRRTYQAIGSLHRQATAMVNEGKNGSVLKKLKNKKEDLITAGTLVDIVDNAGEALESYIQTYSEVRPTHTHTGAGTTFLCILLCLWIRGLLLSFFLFRSSRFDQIILACHKTHLKLD